MEHKQVTQQTKLESSELKNMKAAIYFGGMVLIFVLSAVYVSTSQSPNIANIIQSIVTLQLGMAFAAWAVSKMLPDGWLTPLRTLLSTLVMNAGIVLFVVRR